MTSAIDALEKQLNKEETNLEESWIVHKDGKLLKKFKTHTAAKSHAEKNGATVNSSEYYYDKVHKKLSEEAELEEGIMKTAGKVVKGAANVVGNVVGGVAKTAGAIRQTPAAIGSAYNRGRAAAQKSIDK